MAEYIGVDGVTRELGGMDCGIYGDLRHTTELCFGVDGVVRKSGSWLDTLERFEVTVSTIRTDKIDANDNTVETVGYGLQTANQYGTVSFTNDSIEITCSRSPYEIIVIALVWAVFKDGHKVRLDSLRQDIASISFPVHGEVYFNARSGFYVQDFCGTSIISGHLTTGQTVDVTVVAQVNSSQDDGVFIAAGVYSGSYQRAKQQYRNATVNGKTFPVVVVNPIQ